MNYSPPVAQKKPKDVPGEMPCLYEYLVFLITLANIADLPQGKTNILLGSEHHITT